MSIETIGLKSVPAQVNIQNTSNDVAQSQGGQSIQQIKQQMQIDPSYQPTLQEETIMNAIERANKKLEGADKEFEFTIHEKTKQIMIKILDINTKEVIKELPPEKILDMVAAMCENAGLFVDKKI